MCALEMAALEIQGNGDSGTGLLQNRRDFMNCKLAFDNNVNLLTLQQSPKTI